MPKDLYQIVVWIQFSYHFKEVQEGKDQEKAQSEQENYIMLLVTCYTGRFIEV